MQVDLTTILRADAGEQTDFTVEDETPKLDGVKLAGPLSGNGRILRTEDGVLVTAELATEIELECSRCLRTFTAPLAFTLEMEFMEAGGEDGFGIDKYGKINLDEPVRQEIEVHLPLSPLCQDDCGGIELKQKKDS